MGRVTSPSGKRSKIDILFQIWAQTWIGFVLDRDSLCGETKATISRV